MQRRSIRLTKKKLGAAVLAVSGLGVGALWIAGPVALDTRCYVQCVGPTSATIGKVDRERRALWIGATAAGRLSIERTSPAGEVHAVVFDGLRPGTQYSYTVRVAAADGAVVGGGTFSTAPDDDRAPVRFAAVGDSGNLPWWYNFHKQGASRIRGLLAWSQRTRQWDVAEWIAARSPHFFLHLGDVVYWRDLWDAHGEAFFRPFEPVLRKTPIFMMVGNHDLPEDGSPAPFERIFRNPEDAAARAVGRPQRNFTTAFGSVRLVVYDVNDADCLRQARLQWLDRVLSESSEPWLVVAIHRPTFTVYPQRTPDPALAAQLWPIFDRHGVDLVLSGDDHHYVRFARTPDKEHSPVQLIAGGGGKSLYDIDESDARIAASAKAWSFLFVEAEGLVLTVQAWGAGGRVLDTFRVDRTGGALSPRIGAARQARIRRLRS